MTRCDGLYEHVHVHGSIMVSSRSPVNTRARRCNAGAACNAGGTRTPGRETILNRWCCGCRPATGVRKENPILKMELRYAAVASRGRCEPFQLSLTPGANEASDGYEAATAGAAAVPVGDGARVRVRRRRFRSGAGSRVRVQYVPGAPTARGAAGAQGTARLRTAHTTARH